ncbi:DNA polymerase I [Xanthovirga aplysinae]|uniref:DNA polymerase I n=1 Tax=Xanthovirga aplysinae TaxID=2529853 RepID=UPI0012BBF3F1|nr:DNA polymerase I [Xanthovirga aplysinae]
MSKPENKLFLFDAMALIYRAHFAFSKNPRINSKGQSTGAALGFTNTLLEVIKKEHPTHLAVAFDPPGPTFRHEVFPEYKAHREETPEDIRTAIPIVKDIVKAFNIPVLEVKGFEADDVIGTIAKKAARKGYEVFMMTPDKDYAQLVEEHVYLYKPAYLGNAVDILGVPEVLKKFDLDEVDQIRDLLGLQGDSADNIPGIPGIGPKTATKLLRQFGTVENLVNGADQLKGKQKEKVIEFGQQGILSKELATIHTDVPVDFDPKTLGYQEPNEPKLRAIFEELEFRTLLKRVFEVNSKVTSNAQMSMFETTEVSTEKEEKEGKILKTIQNTPHEYHLADSEQKHKKLVSYLMQNKEVAFDTETSSLDAFEAELVGMSFAVEENKAYYVPVPENKEEAQKVVEQFRPFFENSNIQKIGQNIKYDLLVMRNYGIQVKGSIFDTMLAHYLLEPESRHNMDVLAENYLQYQPVSIETLIGKKGKKQTSMRDVPVKEVKEYAAEDADITLQLKECFAPQVEKEGLQKLLQEVEAPLVNVLANMEYEGIKIDTAALKELSEELAVESSKIEKRIYEIAGEEFNIASPKQLGEILFSKLKLVEKPKKTRTGQYATGEEILSKLADKHEIASLILDFRELQKLKSTYVDALPALISAKDQHIHTSYNQAVTATGRLSSTNPNLQNIPVRTEKGRLIRKAFVPRSEDFILMAADYSQIELRIMAAFAQDEHMIEAFRNKRDIHATTASKIFNVPLEQVDGDMRRKAKTANFGIIYGISAFGLSERLSIPRKEASAIIKAYFSEFPGVKTYMDQVIHDAREKGYVQTILGRKRYLRDINSRNNTIRGFAERNAINTPIQGSAADMIKVAMRDIHQWMEKEGLRSRMILQVHDELVFDVHKEEKDLMKKKVEHFMKHAIELDVPMEIGIDFGQNWLEAH